MEALNYRRAVRVFTFGFQAAEEAFLVKLARDHGGKYVRIK